MTACYRCQSAPCACPDGISLYQGDALEILDRLDPRGLSAMVSDPPYSSGNLPEAQKAKAGPRLRAWKWEDKLMETDQLSTLGFLWFMRSILVAARGRLVRGGSVLLFIDWRNWGNLVGAVESTGLRVNNMVVWDKVSFGMGNGFRNQHELVLWASLGTPRVCDRGTPNVLRYKKLENDVHQSPKPVALMERLLDVVSRPGDLILDPFAGSGSTLLAAKRTGRRAIGIELEPHYAEVAAGRLRENVLPLTG